MRFCKYLTEKYDDKKMLKKLKEVFSRDKFIEELIKDIRIDKKDKPVVCLTVGCPEKEGIKKTFEIEFCLEPSRKLFHDYEIEISYNRDTKIWYFYLKHITDFISENEEEIYNIIEVDEGPYLNTDPYRRGNQCVFTQKELDDYHAKMNKRGY